MDRIKPPSYSSRRAKGKGKDNAQGKIPMTEDSTDATQRVLENAPGRKRAIMIPPPIQLGSKGSRRREEKEDECTPEL